MENVLRGAQGARTGRGGSAAMNRTVQAAAAACSVALGLSGCALRPATTFTLSLVGTNDLHSAMLDVDGNGGLALLDGYLSNLQDSPTAQHQGAVLLSMPATCPGHAGIEPERGRDGRQCVQRARV